MFWGGPGVTVTMVLSPRPVALSLETYDKATVQGCVNFMGTQLFNGRPWYPKTTIVDLRHDPRAAAEERGEVVPGVPGRPALQEPPGHPQPL